jgi:hypothetical protein
MSEPLERLNGAHAALSTKLLANSLPVQTMKGSLRKIMPWELNEQPLASIPPNPGISSFPAMPLHEASTKILVPKKVWSTCCADCTTTLVLRVCSTM